MAGAEIAPERCLPGRRESRAGFCRQAPRILPDHLRMAKRVPSTDRPQAEEGLRQRIEIETEGVMWPQAVLSSTGEARHGTENQGAGATPRQCAEPPRIGGQNALAKLASRVLPLPARLLALLLALAALLLVVHRRLGVQPRAARLGVRLAARGAAQVERPGDRLCDDALFQVRVGDRQQRIDARLLAELRADRELPCDRLVAFLGQADAVERVAGDFPGAGERLGQRLGRRIGSRTRRRPAPTSRSAACPRGSPGCRCRAPPWVVRWRRRRRCPPPRSATRA
jgi:hypothetical protein